MLKFLLATIISLSTSVREPRQVSTAPFDYELSYKIENTYKGFEGSFQHDYEREDGDRYNDIKSELNYTKNLKIGNIHLPNHAIIFKEDYKQITSKDLYQFNSDIRFQFHGISIGYGMIWDLKDKYIYTPSVGLTKKMTLGNWELETENDVYFTKDITYQTEGSVVYGITKNVGLGISGNYIKTLDNYDYSAKAVLTIKLTKN
tara:strand:+ start:146 stop:754 length:609 start_codon:yes stop_codon:yes gene_type:complete